MAAWISPDSRDVTQAGSESGGSGQNLVVFTEPESAAQTSMEPDLFPSRGVGARQGQDWTSRGEESHRAGDDESVETLLLLILTAQSDTGNIVDPDNLYLASRRPKNKENCSHVPRYPRLCQAPEHHRALHLQCCRGQPEQQPGPAPGHSPGCGGHPRHLHLARVRHC